MSLEHSPARQRKRGARAAPADDELTWSIPEAGRKVGLGRSSAYAAAKRGELPVIWYGNLGRVPKAALAKQLESVASTTSKKV